MDYKEKYNDALEWARAIYPNMSKEDKEDMEAVFPELSESEERIRKRLIDLIYKVYANTNYITCAEHEEMLAWLEKQGEQKPFDYENVTIIQRDFAPKGKPKIVPKSKIGD